MAYSNPATQIVSGASGQLSIGMKTGIAIVAMFILYLIGTNRLGFYLGLFTG